MRSGLKDISFVSGLTELTYIDFYNCEISDISAIANLTKLTVLDVMGNHILDMSALSGIYPQMTHLYGLNESATLTLNCTDEENGYCIIKNPVIGIDAAPIAPDSLIGCEYDAATDTFKIPTGTTSFSFTTSQQTVANSADFQNYFKTSVKVNINHPPKTGSLIISKTLDGNSTEPDKKFSFDITLSDNTVNGSFGGVAFTNGVATVSLGDGESVTINGLPDQIGFTVTETDPGDYICSAPNGISGTIDYQTPATAAFTNTRNVFYHVSYLVNEDANYGIPDDATAPVDSRQYAPNESVTVADPLSSSQSYGIEQTTGKQIPGIWSFTPWDKTDFQIAENTTITGAWTFTPTPTPNPKVGNLTVSNTISGNAADSTKAFDFTVTLSDKTIRGTYGDMSFTNGVATFTLKGGESKTATNLPAGATFTVAEADYSADGYVTTKSGDTGTITDGQQRRRSPIPEAAFPRPEITAICPCGSA